MFVSYGFDSRKPCTYHSPLMSGSLHTWYSLPDLDVFAEREAELRGEIELKQLSRLRDMLHADSGSVRVGLRFGPRRTGWLGMQLECETTLRMLCQRCLEPMDLKVAATTKLGLVESAASESLLPDTYEPVLMDGARLKLAQLVEDELLMAVPLVPKHQFLEQCGSIARELDYLGREGSV